MASMIELIQNGGVTSPQGFMAGGVYSGLKTQESDTLDLGILISEHEANLGAVFSQNSVLSPSVTVSQSRAANGKSMGVVANSGCANCCVGTQGEADAIEMTKLASQHLGLQETDFLVCSTGMIGVELPMALIRQNIGNIAPHNDGGIEFAKSIMTTDSQAKHLAVSLDIGNSKVVIGGCAKGVGMIHPNMATMLAFITTDADVDQNFLQHVTKTAADLSFNMISIDGDQSTNDTMLVFANGASESTTITKDSPDSANFQEALNYVCIELAKKMVRDGEGAQRLIEVTVDTASSLKDAQLAARSVSGSMLVKAMVHGNDPNWGRVMMAVGNSEAKIEESKLDIFINEIHVVHGGKAIPYSIEAVINAMDVPDVSIRISLNLGTSYATAWGCDLTEDYVIFNSAYST
ncbi:MAG: bifunctional glutamate N-acetyltransferase/amino-acid acetyltransferase ArgJ [Dehalococcoidia bacterium]